MDLQEIINNLKESKTIINSNKQRNIFWFSKIKDSDISFVGEKNIYLAQIYSNLTKYGIRTANGFAISSKVYNDFIRNTKLNLKIKKILKNINICDIKHLQEKTKEIKNEFIKTSFSLSIENEIINSYKELEKEYGKNIDVVVKSSIISKNQDNLSFSRQYESYLNINTYEKLLDSCKKCFASLFTERAIIYRETKKISHFTSSISIGVQKMIKSDLMASGDIISKDVETGFSQIISITASKNYKDEIKDEYIIFKPTFDEGYKSIISKEKGNKKKENENFILSDFEILLLSRWTIIIEDYYFTKKNEFQPIHLKWAKDNITKEIFIVQAKPEKIVQIENKNLIKTYKMIQEGKVLLKGIGINRKIVHGTIKVIDNINESYKFMQGNILVTDKTDRSWEFIIKKANAVITNKENNLSNVSIISKELGIPAIVGCVDATKKLKNLKKITISCENGIGIIYEDFLKYEISEISIDSIKKTKILTMLDIENPNLIFFDSFLSNDGACILNFEDFEKINENNIEEITKKIAKVTSGVYPKKVFLKFSNLNYDKINLEEINKIYKFRIKIIKKIRNEFGLKNLKLIISNCKKLEDAKEILNILKKEKIEIDKNKMIIFLMCEFPSNIILANDFLCLFNGFLLDIKNLTNLILGLNINQKKINYPENENSVKEMISSTIDLCKIKRKCVGVCNQNSKNLNFIKFLVKKNIDFMSIKAEEIIKTKIEINRIENKMK